MTERAAGDPGFREAIPTVFAFLENDYGFSPIERTPRFVYRSESDDLALEWQVDGGTLVMSMQPKESALPRGKASGPLGIQVILGCIVPDAGIVLSGGRRELSRKEIWGNARKIADYLTRYCQPILRGDFSDWPSERQVRKYLKTFRDCP